MGLAKRLLPAIGAAALLIGFGTTAFATSPFFSTIGADCVIGGTDKQTITVNATAGDYIHIEVTIGSSTANGGTQNGTGTVGSSGAFTDQWTVASVAQATTATVRVWDFAPNGVATARSEFLIQPSTGACPSPSISRVNGILADVEQASNQVKKTCDSGVSGNAGFNVTITVHVSYDTSLTTTITNPSGHTLSLACNGAAATLPVLPVTSVVTLHEVSLPSGAAAAADTQLTIAGEAPATTIHNAKAAAVATPTPTPTPPTLAQTGGGRPSTGDAPLAFLLAMVLIIGGIAARLIYRRS